ncbi:hypothetical protein BD626DRAFT_163305 [Schizophyllum amplum]|uniref:Phytanoyl-CoA dioxygenase n=1 Tax=Schizophyllum amplum TaxID=97359 RepID=A0A550CPI9_9AGAR|nr:hypothetical protein BD626DRAFT_163305 [Auriculariopsis ampla]
MPSQYKQAFDEVGYVIIPDLIPPEARPELEAATARTVARTRAGQWPHRRVVGKQFPPFDTDNPDSWGVQHVMHPDLGEPAFAKWYTSLRNIVTELLACDEDALQMELFNILINPTAHDFALRWHRDAVDGTASPEEEMRVLKAAQYGIQWNTALYRDSCLYVVPGSHRVLRTPEQRAHSTDIAPPENPMDMPGAIRVTLNPGETVFYNSNILHCAVYDSKQPRATLHACMGSTAGGAARAGNILQHGLLWMKEERFRQTLDATGKVMLDRLIEMQESAGEEVRYSLKG